MEKQPVSSPANQSVSEKEEINTSKNYGKYIVPLLVIAVLALSGAVFYVLNRQNASQSSISQELSPTQSEKPTLQPVNTSDWKTYTDEKAGFTFQYPSTILVNPSSNNSQQLVLTVTSEKLSDIPDDLPLSMGRVDALAAKEQLQKGRGPQDIQIGNINGSVSMTLSQFEICSLILSRKLIFYPGEYRVILNLSAPEELVTKQMPEFFMIDKKNCGENLVWNRDVFQTFEPTLKNGKGKGIAQEWYDTFDEMVKTITIQEVTPVVSANQLTYTNNVYGFTISYPKNYKALDDKENLYGYPHGVVLIYAGGQAYDVIIESWDTKAAYEAEYAGRMADVTVHETRGKFITVFADTTNAKNKEIVKSFKLIPH